MASERPSKQLKVDRWQGFLINVDMVTVRFEYDGNKLADPEKQGFAPKVEDEEKCSNAQGQLMRDAVRFPLEWLLKAPWILAEDCKVGIALVKDYFFVVYPDRGLSQVAAAEECKQEDNENNSLVEILKRIKGEGSFRLDEFRLSDDEMRTMMHSFGTIAAGYPVLQTRVGEHLIESISVYHFRVIPFAMRKNRAPTEAEAKTTEARILLDYYNNCNPNYGVWEDPALSISDQELLYKHDVHLIRQCRQ